MSISDLQAVYVPKEDRVRLYLATQNEEEHHFWLTRAVVGPLILELRGQALQALEERLTTQNQQVAFDTSNVIEYKPEPASLTPSTKPLLVTTARVLKEANSSGTNLLLGLATGKRIAIFLPEGTLGRIRQHLQSVNRAACWALPLAAPCALAPSGNPAGSPEVTPFGPSANMLH